MGELIRETPYSEITATLEVLDKLGVRREHLALLRSNMLLARGLFSQLTDERLHGVISEKGFLDGLKSFGRSANWFTFETTSKTLIDLLRDNRDIVYQEPWWKSERFAKERAKAGRRIQVRLSAAPDSFRKTWDEQQALLGQDEFVPTARDLLEGTVLYYRATGKKLFTEYWVRTQDVSSNGHRVDLYWYSVGIRLIGRWDDLLDGSIGLAVARNADEPSNGKEIVLHLCKKCFPYQCVNPFAHWQDLGEQRLSALIVR